MAIVMPGIGLADGADLDRPVRVGGDRRAGLGEPVALVDRDADAAEEVADARAERRAAGDRARALPAERGPQLAEHELVEQGVLQAQDEAGAARVEGLAVGDGRRLGHVEDPALAVVVRLDLGAVVDLLEHARHREQEVGLEAGQLGGQLLRVGEVADRVAVLHRGALDDAGEDVRQREEQQRRVPGLHEVRERVGDGAHLEQQVAVGDLAALGAARGARGVDQRREVVGVHRRPALLQRRVVDARAGVAQGAHRAVGAVDLPDVLELGELLAQVLDDGAVLVGLDDHALGAGVGQAPLDLVGRRGLVDREGRPRRPPRGRSRAASTRSASAR